MLMQKRGTVYDLEEAELCYGGLDWRLGWGWVGVGGPRGQLGV
jgi:hypothetical protein